MPLSVTLQFLDKFNYEYIPSLVCKVFRFCEKNIYLRNFSWPKPLPKLF